MSSHFIYSYMTIVMFKEENQMIVNLFLIVKNVETDGQLLVS
jgi:hypothetical protein